MDSLPTYESLTKEDPSLLGSTVMLKLNGGLGTGMGLEKAKSLLPLKDGATFLDFIAQQVELTREKFKVDLAFMLMNSFSTSADTLATSPNTRSSRSTPPGCRSNFSRTRRRGDGGPGAGGGRRRRRTVVPAGARRLYPALVGSGMLDQLGAKGYKYMFVSNSDNLGATMDLKLLTWFAESGADFAMEAAAHRRRQEGRHLANKAGGGLLLPSRRGTPTPTRVRSRT